MRFALIALIGATQAMRLTHGPPRQEGGDRPEGDRPEDTIPGDGTVQGHSNPCPGEDCQEPEPMTDEEYAMREEIRQSESSAVDYIFDQLDQKLDTVGFIDLNELEVMPIAGTDIEAHLKLEMKQEIAAFDFNGDDQISLDEMESARAWVTDEYAQWNDLPEDPTEEEEYDYQMKVSERDQIFGLMNIVEDEINGPGGNEEWLHIDQVVDHAWNGDEVTDGMAATFTNQYHDHLQELDFMPEFEHDDGSISHGDGVITADEIEMARGWVKDMHDQERDSDTCHQGCTDMDCHDHCNDQWNPHNSDNDHHDSDNDHHDSDNDHHDSDNDHDDCHVLCDVDDEECYQVCRLH